MAVSGSADEMICFDRSEEDISRTFRMSQSQVSCYVWLIGKLCLYDQILYHIEGLTSKKISKTDSMDKNIHGFAIVCLQRIGQFKGQGSVKIPLELKIKVFVAWLS
jgi:hypothetical protein